jgi:hypothetical protein
MTPEKFEVWAIVELFGHNKIAGKVTEQVIGSASFIRLDVPNVKSQPAFTRLLHANAIYAINPVTEEVATQYAEQLKVMPINAWDAREVLNRIDEMKKLSAPSKPEEVPMNYFSDEDEDNHDAQIE